MKRDAARVIFVGLTSGALLGGLALPLTGHREAFDAHFAYYLGTTFAAGVISTLPAPRFWWLAFPFVFLGEHLYYFAAFPDMRPWFLFGIIINAQIPTWWTAATGALAVFLVDAAIKFRRTHR